MKINFLAIMLALLVSGGCSKIQLAGVSTTKYLNVPGDYSGIVVDGAMTVEVSSSCDMMEITSDSNVLPYIDIRIVDKSLVIGYEKGAKFSSGNFSTTIRLPYSTAIGSVSISGMSLYRCMEDTALSSKLRLEARDMSSFEFGSLSASSLALTLHGASSFVASALDVPESSLNFTEASSATVSGSMLKCDAVLSGASVLYPGSGSSSLSVDRFSSTLSGASSARFHSDGVISGTLRDASVIYYSGSAVCESVSCFTESEIIRE